MDEYLVFNYGLFGGTVQRIRFDANETFNLKGEPRAAVIRNCNY